MAYGIAALYGLVGKYVNPVYINRADARRGEKLGLFVDLVEKVTIFQRNPVYLALVPMNQLRRRELEIYSIVRRLRWNLSSS